MRPLYYLALLLLVPSVAADTTTCTTVGTVETCVTSYDTQDFWLPLLIWVVAMWMCLRRAKAAAAFTALLGLLNEIVTPTPGSRLGYLLLFILVLWLEALAGDRLWSRWLNREKESETK